MRKHSVIIFFAIIGGINCDLLCSCSEILKNDMFTVKIKYPSICTPNGIDNKKQTLNFDDYKVDIIGDYNKFKQNYVEKLFAQLMQTYNLESLNEYEIKKRKNKFCLRKKHTGLVRRNANEEYNQSEITFDDALFSNILSIVS